MNTNTNTTEEQFDDDTDDDAGERQPQDARKFDGGATEQRLANIEARMRQAGLASELRLSGAQAEAVDKLMQANADLAPAEAARIAALRAPDTFADVNFDDPGSAQYLSLRPGRGRAPAAKPASTAEIARYAHSLSGRNKAEMKSMVRGVCAAAALRAVGVAAAMPAVPDAVLREYRSA